MNRINNNNNIIKENELKNEKFFAPRNNSHYNWLEEFLGKKYNVVYEAAESWDSDNFNHHREAGKYNNENGGEITYKYEHHINKNGGYHKEWSKSWKDPQIWRESIMVRPDNLKSLGPNFGNLENDELAMHQRYLREFQEKKHDLEMKIIEERDNPKSCCDKHLQERIKAGKPQQMIAEWKKEIEVLETKIQCEKDWLAKNVGNDNKSKLVKENQDLKKQLTKVKQELVRVSEELKNLKDSLTDKDKEELAREFIEIQEQNDELINNPNVSAAEIRGHAVKLENLGKKVNARNVNTETFSTNSPDGKDNSNLLIGGGVALISILTVGFGYYLVKKKKNK